MIELARWRSLASRLRGRPASDLRRVRLAWLTRERIAEVKGDPMRLPALYAAHQDRWREDLGPGLARLSRREREWLFSFSVAHACAPWDSAPPEMRFPQMLEVPFLSCANYALLGWHLAKIFPAATEDDALRVHFVGWESPAIGNHQMVFLSRDRGDMALIVDPTLGLVAHGSFDEVAAGEPLDIAAMTLFDPREELRAFEELVVQGLARGALRASHLLYYFEDPRHLVRAFADPDSWPTPGAIRWRAKQSRGA